LLVRYLSDGRGDPAFGAGGKVTIAVGSGSSANGLVVQPNGKLVVAGSATVGVSSPDTPLRRNLLLARLSPDGRPDATFGSGGLLTTTVESNSSAFALLQQPDGKLVVAGTSDPAPANNQTSTAFLVRYHSDGRVDASFGTEGTVTIGRGGLGLAGTNVPGALILQPDGKLVVAPPGVPLRVVRVQSDGRLDATFGSGGAVTIASEAPGDASLVLQSDGKLVVANSMQGLRVLTRLQSDGRLDATFGSGGIATTGVPIAVGGNPFLILQPDGKLVVVGATTFRIPSTDTFLSHLLLARVQPDGRRDVTFGTGGTVTTTVQGSSTGPTLLQQSDGNLVLASMHASVPGTRFAVFDILLARYQVLGCPAIDPDPCLASLAASVTDVYVAALARPPDASEVAYWVEVLATAPSPDTVRGMLHVVFEGPEFRQRPVHPWQYVDALYQAMLGRTPDQGALDWWVQAVLDRVNSLLPAFLDLPEFQRLVPSCHDQAAVTLLVGRLYQQVLGRVASPDELAWWTQDIMTRCAIEDAVAFFFNSLDYLSVPRTLADHVTVLDRALLAREPAAGEQAWWVAYLAGQLVEIEDDVMASPEFEAHVYRLFP
jgi:uncharacterized delta-60 repeat protein